MLYLERAREIYEDAVEFRRDLHMNPEVGFDTYETAKKVKEKLESFDIESEYLPDTAALVGTLGNPDKGKTLLLRADMDALEMEEKTGLEFSSKNDYAHMCGHDMHTTILLMALKLLKEDEDELEGEIKFLFQPAEELLIGGKKVVEAGVLENPEPDAGMAVHMSPTSAEVGVEIHEHEALASALNFRITVNGKGAHGAMPYTGIDPVFVGSLIITAANGIIARELPSNKGASLSMGFFDSPSGAMNIIPDQVIIEGTSRSLYAESAEHVAKRLPEVAKYIAKAFNAEVEFEVLADVPSLINTEEMTKQVQESAEEVLDGEYPVKNIPPILASEDYAHIASRLPESSYIFIGCPLPDEDGNVHALHNPQTRFNEEALLVGSATVANSAKNWLRDNK